MTAAEVRLVLKHLIVADGRMAMADVPTARMLGERFMVADDSSWSNPHELVLYELTARAIRAACQRLRTFKLNGCLLVASCEPCPLCFSAALWARMDRVIFAADRHDAAGHRCERGNRRRHCSATARVSSRRHRPR